MSKLKVFAPKSLTAFTMLKVEISHKFKKNADLLTNVKKFICGKCPRTFKTQKGLDTHERQCQGDDEEKQKKKGLKCEYCEEIAKTPKGLRSHCKKKHGIDLSDTCSETSDN